MISIRKLASHAATLQQISVREVCGATQNRKAVRARWAVAWAATKEMGESSVVIGRELGRRDHSTILYGLKQAERLRSTDLAFRRLSDVLRAMIVDLRAIRSNADDQLRLAL
jgi:chromosomal replication initiator protein